MKKLFGFLRKKEEPVKKSVYGITDPQYYGLLHAMEVELGTAAGRQRPGTAEPSPYMKGLLFAIKLLEACKPHIVGVEQ